MLLVIEVFIKLTEGHTSYFIGFVVIHTTTNSDVPIRQTRPRYLLISLCSHVSQIQTKMTTCYYLQATIDFIDDNNSVVKVVVLFW